MLSLLLDKNIKISFQNSDRKELKSILSRFKSEEFKASNSIEIDEVSEEMLINYRKIVDELKGREHYWISPIVWDDNGFIINVKCGKIYETSIMREVVNEKVGDDYTLILGTSHNSLIDGLYIWKFKYGERKISMYYEKSGKIGTNVSWIVKQFVRKEKVKEIDQKWVKAELEYLKSRICKGEVDYKP